MQTGLSLENIAWSFTTFRDGNWIPFTWLSLMLDTTVFGFHATGYHVTNVLLHLANTVLVFAFLARATGNPLRMRALPPCLPCIRYMWNPWLGSRNARTC